MKALLIRYFSVMMCVALSGWALLYTSQSVQKAKRELAVIEADIAAENARIDVLNAEWSYLNNPGRLEDLAQKTLDLVPAKTSSKVMVREFSAIPFAPEVPHAQPALFEAGEVPHAE